MKPIAAAALVISIVANVAYAEEPMFEFIEKDTDSVELTIDLSKISSYVIPAEIFGKFSENLGNNIYGGFWAQILENPSIEPIRNCKPSRGYSGWQRGHLKRITREDLPTPYEEENLGYWWFRWNGDSANYSFSEEAYNSQYSQSIIAEQIPDGIPAVGIRQLVDLPVSRTRKFDLAFYVKGSSKTRLIAQIRSIRSPEQVYASVEFPVAGGDTWQKYSGRLSIYTAASRLDSRFWFTLGLAEPGEIKLDQVTLFPDDSVDGFDPEVLRWARDSKIQLLRFPGGNYVSGYQWKDDLAAIDKRPTKPNPAWDICDPHHVGMDEHLRFCQLIGAEPLICINAGDGMPEDAADLVEYCNGGPETRWGKLRQERGFPEPFNVRYWEIGNELWGDWQIGHCTAEEYASRYRAFYTAMKAIDPSISFIACGHVQDDWNKPLLEQCDDILRSLSVHLLFTCNTNAPPEYCYLSQLGYSHILEDVFRRIHQKGQQKGLDLKIAITEEIMFNHGKHQPNASTLSEALYYSGVVNSAIRTKGIVEIFTHSALINHGGGLRKSRGIVYADPVYYARRQLQRLAGGRPVKFRLTCPFSDIPEWQEAWAGPSPKRFPLIDVMTVRQKDALQIVLLNRSPDKPYEVEIHIHRGHFDNQADLFLLQGSSFMASNEVVNPNRVIPVNQSIQVASTGTLQVECKSSSISMITLREQGQ